MWEYHVEWRSSGQRPDTERLNVLGAMGWELVAVTRPGFGYVLVFKRFRENGQAEPA